MKEWTGDWCPAPRGASLFSGRSPASDAVGGGTIAGIVDGAATAGQGPRPGRLLRRSYRRPNVAGWTAYTPGGRPRLLPLLVLRDGAPDVGAVDLPRRADARHAQQGDADLPVGFPDGVEIGHVGVLFSDV